MNRPDVQAWLDRYIEAWRSSDADDIRALFTDDASYRYRPYGAGDGLVEGQAEIVKSWLDQADETGTWEAEYEPYAVDGDRAVAIGFSRYLASGSEPEKTYHNAFLLRFAADGRCAEFTEYFMLEQPPRES